MPKWYDQHWITAGEMIAASRPARLLVIDRNPEVPPAGALARHRPDRITVLAGATLMEIAALERHDLAIVANTVEHMEKREATRLLARLRDVQAGRLLALVPVGRTGMANEPWTLADLLGLGMQILERHPVEDASLVLGHYAITSYKTTPRWFNNRFWAHPERWKP